MSYIGHSDERPYSDTAKDKNDLNDVLNFKKKFEENFGSLSSQIFTEVVFRNVKGQSAFPVTINPKTVEVELNGIRLVKCPDGDVVFANGDFTATSGMITLAQPISKEDYTLTVRSEGLSIQQQYSIIEQVPVGTSMLWFSDKAIPIGYIAMLGQAPADIQQYPDLLKLFPAGLPNTEHDFIRGAGPNRAVLTRQSDAIRNITGSLNYMMSYFEGTPAQGIGALNYKYRNVPNKMSITASNPPNTGTADPIFDASLAVPTADENRPRNLSAFYIVKAFSTLQNGGYKDVSEQLKQLYELSLSKSASSVPAGITAMWSSAEPIPAGWLPLWGQTKEELSMYPAAVRLYPNGMPDTRLQFVRGADGSTRVVGSLQLDNMKKHNHQLNGLKGGSPTGNASLPSSAFALQYFAAAADLKTLPTTDDIWSGAIVGAYTQNSLGDSQNDETRPKNIAFFYIVKIYDYATIPEVADFTYVVQQLKPKLDRLRFGSSWISADKTQYWYKVPLQDGRSLLVQGGRIGLQQSGQTLPYVHKLTIRYPITYGGLLTINECVFVTGAVGIDSPYTVLDQYWRAEQKISIGYPLTDGFTASVTVPDFVGDARRFVWRSEAIINK